MPDIGAAPGAGGVAGQEVAQLDQPGDVEDRVAQEHGQQHPGFPVPSPLAEIADQRRCGNEPDDVAARRQQPEPSRRAAREEGQERPLDCVQRQRQATAPSSQHGAHKQHREGLSGDGHRRESQGNLDLREQRDQQAARDDEHDVPKDARRSPRIGNHDVGQSARQG